MKRCSENDRPVPLLVTWDVDPSPELPYEARCRSLDVTLELCAELTIPTTFFVTASADHVHPVDLERIQAAGHEVGCHGLTHGNEEEYDRMPESMQRDYIERATRKLADWSGSPIVSFRSPRVKVSGCTMRLLAESGYLADSSVCSQRLDVISSNLINPGWLVAPRRPYRPHPNNAFRRGDLPIWEVPISALGLPFISASLGLLGLGSMKALFRLLYAESRRTGKPIVYLGHPVEFTSRWLKPFTFQELTPSYIRTHGLLLRKRLMRMDSAAWLGATRELFVYMRSFAGVQFMSLRECTMNGLGA